MNLPHHHPAAELTAILGGNAAALFTLTESDNV